MSPMPAPVLFSSLSFLFALAACSTPPAATSGVAGIDLTLLQPRDERFTVLIQDRPAGSQVCRLEREGQGWLYTETTTIEPMVQQTTELWMDAAGRMQRVRQRGSMAGKPMQIDACYADGRVVADAVTPSAPAPVHSDQPIGPDVLDDNALQALLPALCDVVAEGRTLTVFSTGKGKVIEARLERVATEVVATAVGQVEAWRIRGTIDGAGQDFVVTASKPHTILRMIPIGSPVVMQREQ